MRLTFTVVDPLARRSADVVLDAAPEVPAGQVGAAVTRLLRPGARTATLYVEGTAVDPQLPLSTTPLRDGALASLDDPAAGLRPEPAGLVEIRVVSGPDAGGVFRLDPGVAQIGGDPGATVSVQDPSLPPVAGTVEVAADATAAVTPTPDLPTWLDGQRLTGPAPWPVGGQLAVGWTVLELAVPAPPDAAVQPSEDGGLDYNRPPRLRLPDRVTRFRMPSPPTQGERRPLPILMALAPLVLAGVMVWLSGGNNLMYLGFALLSPVMVIGNYITDRRSGRKSYGQRRSEYIRRKTALEAEARAALHAEEVVRRVECPDPAVDAAHRGRPAQPAVGAPPR